MSATHRLKVNHFYCQPRHFWLCCLTTSSSSAAEMFDLQKVWQRMWKCFNCCWWCRCQCYREQTGCMHHESLQWNFVICNTDTGHTTPTGSTYSNIRLCSREDVGCWCMGINIVRGLSAVCIGPSPEMRIINCLHINIYHNRIAWVEWGPLEVRGQSGESPQMILKEFQNFQFVSSMTWGHL